MKIDKSKYPIIKNCINFSILFSTKEDGNMIRNNENREVAHRNRMNFLNKNGIDLKNFARVRPTDSPNIEIIEINNGIYKKKFL